ncbi:hypothetical protein [uncultured Bartonella sp.]|uniref:hypothetical protein n=1 Tax=uncultured Bartonella sp. TaxID=104108 RepID=UPI00262F18FC|nr:hypothetical protein [uncultured Bartonella sp.]
MHKKKWIVGLILLIGIVAAIPLTFNLFVDWLGRSELYAFAQDKNYCRTESCDEGIAYVTELLHKQSGIDEKNVPWCMATNRIYYTDLYSLNGLKVKFTNWMYQTCERSELTLDDANIEIGEQPHEHNDQDEH